MKIIFSSHKNAENREVIENLLLRYASSKLVNIYSRDCLFKINKEKKYDLLVSDRTEFIFPHNALKNIEISFNTHPSMLPIHKGSQPIFWATLFNDPLGISIHQINEKIDQGDILYQKHIDYHEDDSFSILHRTCRKEILFGIEQVLASLKKTGSVRRFPANDSLLKKHPTNFHHMKIDCINLMQKLQLGWDTPVGVARQILKSDIERYKRSKNLK